MIKFTGSFILILVALLVFTDLSFGNEPSTIRADCTFQGKKLFGKIQIVQAFPDIKVQIVESFPDLKVEKVTAFPSECGKWQIVENLPDLKVQFVDTFPDLKIQFVQAFPGLVVR